MSIKGFFVNGQIRRYDYGALDNKQSGVSEAVRDALLQLAQKVAYIDENGQDYYQDLYDALYASSVEITSISALFSQGSTVVYTTDTLNSLKPMLTVTANYSDGSSETVTSYSLYGTLTAGTSTINVFYEGFSTTFDVTVTAVAGVYTITNTLSNCTSSNSATTIQENSSYAATITASTGYTLFGATVSVTMGGVNVTNTAYSNGTISIASVTGDLVITVTAAAKVLSSISAVYTQSGTVYDTDSLQILKSDLAVTASYADSSTQTVPAADYTLSGTLTAGTSTITVSYGGKTTTFTVTVTAWDLDWEYSMGNPENNGFSITVTSDASSPASATMEDDGLHILCKNSVAVAPTTNFTAGKGVAEFVLEFTSMPQDYQGLAINTSSGTKGARTRIYNGNVTLGYSSTNDEAHTSVIYSGISVGVEYTLRIEWDIANGYALSVNGTSVYTLAAALNATPPRLLITATGSPYSANNFILRAYRAKAVS